MPKATSSRVVDALKESAAVKTKVCVCVCVRVYLLYISGARQYTIEALCKVALETHKEAG